MLVEECHLLGRRRLEHLGPSRHSVSFYGWLLHAPALNPLEEDIRRRSDITQLNSSAKGSCPDPQGIPLAPSPGAPLDDYDQAEREEFLSQPPLQRLDLAAPVFIPQV